MLKSEKIVSFDINLFIYYKTISTKVLNMLKKHIESTFFMLTKEKNMLKIIAKLVSALSIKITEKNINTGCTFIVYQPKLPTSANRLRKF